MVVALDLSEAMLVQDIQPSRLERAQQKARDILAGRRGARTGLLAYAGSAHVVLPLCDDPSVFEEFLRAERLKMTGQRRNMVRAALDQR